MDVAVVGAGAVGTTLAYDLARRDTAVSVTLFERDRPGAGASGRAAGVCYPAYADALDAELARRAMARFRRFRDDGGFTFVDHPYVWFAHPEDDSRCAAIREQVERMREHGLDVEAPAPTALAERFPTLRTGGIGVAGVANGAAYAAPGDYVRAMADRAETAGVNLRTGSPVSVDTDPPGVLSEGGSSGRFDAVVVAAGAHTKRVLADAGIPIAMAPYRVQALIAEPAPEPAPPMAFDATAGFYARPWHGGGLLLGDGTVPVEADPDRWDRDADQSFTGAAADRLSGVYSLPGPVTVDRGWAGLCTATPDGDPLVGELRPGVFVATGWQGHGFMRAPAIAEVLADAVLGTARGRSARALAAFDPTRFSGDEPIEIVEGMEIGVEDGSEPGTG